MASAWSSGNSESVWPCMIRVGTLMRSPTADGLRDSSSRRAASSGLPLTATRSYVRHSSGSKRTQPPGALAAAPAGPPDVPAGPVVKKIPAHSFLNTPWGKSASARFQ